MVGPPPALDAKAELRAALRQRRRAFVSELGDRRLLLEAELGRSASTHVGDLACIAAYRARGAELNPDAICRVLAPTKVVALPSVDPDSAVLSFRVWRPGDRLVTGPHGIEEPASEAPVVVPDLMFLPLVGFDRRGGRLGQGGGFYDRTLVMMRGVRRIGLAWSVQEVERVPMDPWDVPLDAVLTEKEWIECR